MNIEEIIKLLKIGQLAVEHAHAIEAASYAKHVYYKKIGEFEEEFGEIEGRLDRYHPDQQRARDYTGTEYRAYLDARRIANNLKRRVQAACWKATAQATS